MTDDTLESYVADSDVIASFRPELPQVYKCPLILLLSPLWQMPLWHHVALATALLSGIISLSISVDELVVYYPRQLKIIDWFVNHAVRWFIVHYTLLICRPCGFSTLYRCLLTIDAGPRNTTTIQLSNRDQNNEKKKNQPKKKKKKKNTPQSWVRVDIPGSW